MNEFMSGFLIATAYLPSVVSQTLFKAGNAMSVNVLTRIMAKLLPACGLMQNCIDPWEALACQ